MYLQRHHFVRPFFNFGVCGRKRALASRTCRKEQKPQPLMHVHQANLDGFFLLSPSPGLTSPLCHRRHLRPGSPSRPSSAQAPNAGVSDPAPRAPAIAGSLASGAPGPDSDVGFALATSDPDSDTPSCRPRSGALAARASALPPSRRRPSASSVAAGTSRAVTGVLLEVQAGRKGARSTGVKRKRRAREAEGGGVRKGFSFDQPAGHWMDHSSIRVLGVFCYLTVASPNAVPIALMTARS